MKSYKTNLLTKRSFLFEVVKKIESFDELPLNFHLFLFKSQIINATPIFIFHFLTFNELSYYFLEKSIKELFKIFVN